MPNSYTVKKGESFASIAAKLYKNDPRMFGELMRANKGVLMLHPGDKIRVPNKVKNPFVSFAQAAWAAGVSSNADVDKTMTMISGMKGGAEWIASLGAGTGTGTAQPTQPFGNVAGNPQQMAQAQFAQNALNQKGTTLNNPASMAARENAGVTSSVQSPADRVAKENAVYAPVPGQASVYQGHNLTESQAKAAPQIVGYPDLASKITKGVMGLSGTAPLQSGMVGAAPTTPLAPNAYGWTSTKPSGETTTVAGDNGWSKWSSTKLPGATAALPGAAKPTGANNLSSSGTNKTAFTALHTRPEYHAYILDIASIPDDSLLPDRISRDDAAAIAIAGGELNPANAINPAEADAVAAQRMKKMGYVMEKGWYVRSKTVVEDVTTIPNLSGGAAKPGVTLDWKNMSVSTLSQMGFYSGAPSQPTFDESPTGRAGGEEPASWLRVSGSSWQIRP